MSLDRVAQQRILENQIVILETLARLLGAVPAVTNHREIENAQKRTRNTVDLLRASTEEAES